MGLAEKTQGRIISQTINVRLTPPETDELGDTDEATEIGKGLIAMVMKVLKEAAEAEGFKVDIEVRQLIY